MKRKFSSKEREYWSQVFIACSQVTFGLSWGSMLVPLDRFKLIMILLNAGLSILFWISGWIIMKGR